MYLDALKWLILLLPSAFQNTLKPRHTLSLDNPLTNGIQDAFTDAAEEQIRICKMPWACQFEGALFRSECCGFCSCDFPSCTQYGSCCLKTYGSFNLGRDSVRNNRYKCVNTQFLPPEDTDFNTGEFVWLITKCAPDYNDSTVIEQCENPGQVLESVVPVTEPATRLHYRNIHCAHCNWVENVTLLIYWNIQIKSNQLIHFPNDNLLSFIHETRGNVFFLRPEYFTIPSCKPIPEYSIGTCNETGLWREYKDETKIACDSFVDPFNNTYKNYFCYLCNTATLDGPENWSCPRQYKEIENKAPRFSAVLDLSAVINQGNIICKGTQFKDLNRMTCRDVVCHNEGEMFDGICRAGSKTFNDTCFSVFVKLTPLPREKPLHLADIDFPLFAHVIKYTLKEKYSSQGSAGTSSSQKDSFRIFYKTDNEGYVKYVVVYIQTSLQSSKEIYKFLDNLLQLPVIELNYMFELYFEFSVELALYNITESAQNTTVFISHGSYLCADEILSDTVISDSNICPHTDAVQLNNLYRCPYIILGIEEISMKIMNDFLYIPGYMVNDEYPKVLSKSDYEIHDEKIHICLYDYLDIYHLMPRPNMHSMDFFNSRAVSKHIYSMFSLILFPQLILLLFLYPDKVR